MVRLAPVSLAELAARFGGALRSRKGGDAADNRVVSALRPARSASLGHLTVLLSSRYVQDARDAAHRGAVVLAANELGADHEWTHAAASWAMAQILTHCVAPLESDAAEVPLVGEGSVVGPGVFLGPRVHLGRNVKVGAGAVIGHPGFGWATGPDGGVVAVPQLGGVVIEDDVSIGPLCTIDAGTLGPTRVRRGAKLDAHVHVGHNGDIGEGTLVAAQCGFAGSVTVGRGVLVGGQVGVADHVTIGDGARIAAKSGVIGDVAPGETVAGYPAVPRARWLRSLAWLHRSAERS